MQPKTALKSQSHRRCFTDTNSVCVVVGTSYMAGYGSLSISTEGAYRMDLTCKNKTVNDLRGEYLLQYKPQEPGIYLLNIKYGDDQIAG